MDSSTIAGVLEGGLIGFLSAAGARLFEDHRAQRTLRAAFRAELSSVLRIAEIGEHEKNFTALLAAWKSGSDYRPAVFGFEEGMRWDRVFTENVDKIGTLGRHAAGVVLFYTQLEAVRIAIHAVAEGGIYEIETLEGRVRFVEQSLGLWAETRSLGEKLVKEL